MGRDLDHVSKTFVGPCPEVVVLSVERLENDDENVSVHGRFPAVLMKLTVGRASASGTLCGTFHLLQYCTTSAPFIILANGTSRMRKLRAILQSRNQVFPM